MSLSLLALTSPLQKRVLKFVLKRAIGQFLQSELDLEQLDVQLGEGRVVIRDVVVNTRVSPIISSFWG